MIEAFLYLIWCLFLIYCAGQVLDGIISLFDPANYRLRSRPKQPRTPLI